MENTRLNKTKFFAAHYGGEAIIIKGSYTNKLGEIKTIDASNLLLLTQGLSKVESAVLVKPLSSITDEDAIEVIRNSYLGMGEKGLQWAKEMIKKGRLVNSQYSTDYLRLKGYAFRYFNLSVEQQIEYNWIKLKTE